MTQRRVHSTAPILFVLTVSSCLFAQEARSVGDARNALPGLHRIPFVGVSSAGSVHAALDAGYGMTESLAGEGAHHRFLGSLGIGVVPWRGLELGLSSRIRHDRHPDDGHGTDSGTVGDLAFVSRLGTRYGEALMLGIDVGATFPGAEHWSERAKSLSVDLRTILGWVPSSGIRYAAIAGFRFDNTGAAGVDASRYRFGDRMALGLSDYHAVLIGAGLSIPLGQLELIGELSGDVLVGANAPSIARSPLRVDVGVRHALTARLAAELLTEASLSQRPNVGPAEPLIPIEPRFSVALGLRYRWGDEAPTATASQSPRQIEAPPASSPSAAAAESPTGRASVSVLDEAGNPLSDAVVKVVSDSGERPLEFSHGSTYVGQSLKPGRARVVVQAELMRDWEQAVEIPNDGQLELRVTMVAAENSGQIRGQIRAFNGTSLSAHVHIEPGNHEVNADAAGTFRLDVPPGNYRVRIEMEGYQPQQRTVVIRKSGVMVLNVDLEKVR